MVWRFKDHLSISNNIKAKLGTLNVNRTKTIAWVLLCLQIILIGVEILTYFGFLGSKAPGFFLLLSLHVLFILFLIGFLISVRILKISRKNYGWKAPFRLSIAGTVIILLICALVSVIDQSIHSEITVYIAGAFSIASLIYLPLLESIAVFLPSLIILIGGVTFLQGDHGILIGHYVNSILFTGLAFIFSRIMFSYFLRDHQNLELIKEQNRQLEIRKEELRHQAYEDSLTHIYNRRYAEEQLIRLFEHSKRYARPFTIAFADLDRFKAINDNYSHQVGDKALVTVADIFKRDLRKTDIAARYGGEEFLLLLPETEMEEAYQICERIRTSIESYPWQAVRENLTVTLSLGLAESSESTTYRALMKKADEKLYLAKETGRNRTVR